MTDKIEVSRELLEALVETLDRADTSEGYCCCGDDMQNHPDPMYCGHSPVDAGVYYAGKQRDELKALLSEAKQPAAAGEEIMVNTPYDVFTLPLQPSGLSSGPRFVVHVPGPEQPEGGAS